MDHDISLLILEIWCRLFPTERDPARMIERGELEKIDDFEYEGQTVPASRLGCRITERFVHTSFGRLFENPSQVFTKELLRPETQDLAVHVDGIQNLAEAQQKSAEAYFKAGSIEHACPPLKVVLHCMAYGHYEGKTIDNPELRAMFTREALLASDWYKARLLIKQEREVALWQRHVSALETFLNKAGYDIEEERLDVANRLEAAKQGLERVSGARTGRNARRRPILVQNAPRMKTAASRGGDETSASLN